MILKTLRQNVYLDLEIHSDIAKMGRLGPDISIKALRIGAIDFLLHETEAKVQNK